MRLSLSDLDQRYDRLRIQDAGRLSRVLESLLAHGQQVPVVVVPMATTLTSHVLIDGYLRVAALGQLHEDEVLAQEWQMPEGQALALAHRLDNARERSALEEGWLLSTLEREHGMQLAQLSILLGRSRSWVSRRLGLAKTLPAQAQEAVRAGRVSAQAAQRYLLPLARANAKQCETLAGNLRGRVSVRQMHALYVTWRGADAQTKERIAESPMLFMAAHEAHVAAPSMRDELMHDLDIACSVVHRAQRRVDEGALSGKAKAWATGALRRCRDAEDRLRGLATCLEELDARLGNSDGDPAAVAGGAQHSRDLKSAGHLAQRDPKGAA